MQTLDRALRSQLENTIKNAREIAEMAAKAALEQICVGSAKPDSTMNEAQINLRRRLRAHGRQLGDVRDSSQTQVTYHLIEEVAYQHWHRMLFARFLAENNLLMFFDNEKQEASVSVSLEECNELAEEMGAKNGWELASKFASKMLPQIFRVNSPVFELEFAPEQQKILENMISSIPSIIFMSSDSLGWVYQFWQSKQKNIVNKSEKKIGAVELPAVTQLFTEPYMVQFLLDNSLGAWWAARRLSEFDLRNANNEEELRIIAAIPGVPLKYLRFVKNEHDSWILGSDSFKSLPNELNELRILDPCCGSGHFLVAALLMLIPMRMECEQLSIQSAIDAVLSENIYGLEIDKRCVELAAFALAITAWTYPNNCGYRKLPELNLACSGLAINAKKEDWISLSGDDIKLRMALESIYSQFADGPILGSLIDPEIGQNRGSLFETNWENIELILAKAISLERDDDVTEMGVNAYGLVKTAAFLTKKYDLIVTNPPYLKSGNQIEKLKAFSERYFPLAKRDLATVFLLRCLELNSPNGVTCLVLPQNWLFLKTYSALRSSILKEHKWCSLVKLGSGAFDTISGEVVQVILFTIGKGKPNTQSLLFGLDSSKQVTPDDKSFHLANNKIVQINQKNQLSNPDCIISISETDFSQLVSDVAKTAAGLSSFDRPRFFHYFWEQEGFIQGWIPSQSTVEKTTFYGGCEYAILWENGEGKLKYYMDEKKRLEGYTSAIWRAGSQFWGNKGILVSLMGDIPVTLYMGYAFDQNTALLVPNSKHDFELLWGYCKSKDFGYNVRQVDQSLKVTTATLEKIPYKSSVYDQNNLSEKIPEPFTNDPTQWIFHGHPSGTVLWDETLEIVKKGKFRRDEQVLQVAVTRLLGYQWPVELDQNINLSRDARELAISCNELLQFADKDGIVCIPAIGREASASDRLVNLLSAAYGTEWNSNTVADLLTASEWSGKSLESWLRDGFFSQHCKFFQNKPLIWHIWDGQPDGFSALLNYHKLNQNNLQVLIYSYLDTWIKMQKEQISQGVDGAEDRLSAAEGLRSRLLLILEGESPYDIFVRWKKLSQQPIGWNPDLNDGIRLNIRPWMSVPDIKKKGAGVLRDKPNIKWDKDRGQDVASAPWYILFNGDRINDHHLTLKEKRSVKADKNFGGDHL
jgi:hypothetical protein